MEREAWLGWWEGRALRLEREEEDSPEGVGFTVEHNRRPPSEIVQAQELWFGISYYWPEDFSL